MIIFGVFLILRHTQVGGLGSWIRPPAGSEVEEVGCLLMLNDSLGFENPFNMS